MHIAMNLTKIVKVMISPLLKPKRIEEPEFERQLARKGLKLDSLGLIYISSHRDERYNYQLWFEGVSITALENGKYRIKGTYAYEVLAREGNGVLYPVSSLDVCHRDSATRVHFDKELTPRP